MEQSRPGGLWHWLGDAGGGGGGNANLPIVI